MAKKLKGVVTTASGAPEPRVAALLSPMPEAASASQRASVPLAQPMAKRTAQAAGRGGLEGGNLRAEDEVLRVADPRDGVQNLLPEGRELAREVQHGNGLRSGFGHCKPWYNAGRLNPLPRHRV